MAIFTSITVIISTAAGERRAWNTCRCFTISECHARHGYLSGARGQDLSALLSSAMDFARRCVSPTSIQKRSKHAGVLLHKTDWQSGLRSISPTTSRGIPTSEQWDLVVGNPPHFVDISPGELRFHDEEWKLHRHFFGTIGRFLKPGGIIVLLENNRGSTAETFRGMIEAAGLSIVFVHNCEGRRTPYTRTYYIGIARRGDAVPAWARLPVHSRMPTDLRHPPPPVHTTNSRVL